MNRTEERKKTRIYGEKDKYKKEGPAKREDYWKRGEKKGGRRGEDLFMETREVGRSQEGAGGVGGGGGGLE